MPTPPEATSVEEAGGQQLGEAVEVGAVPGAVDVDLGDHRAPPPPHPRSSGSRSATSRPEPCSQPRTATSRPRTSSPTATGTSG